MTPPSQSDREREADALYVALEQCFAVDKTIETPACNIDIDNKGHVGGIEILYPRQPLRLAKVAAEHGFAHALDDIYAVTQNVMGVQIGAPGSLNNVCSGGCLPRVVWLGTIGR